MSASSTKYRLPGEEEPASFLAYLADYVTEHVIRAVRARLLSDLQGGTDPENKMNRAGNSEC
jgi:hypothetical protein